ncbi:tryptophan synthase subunit alpha [Streptomyces sp. NPDC055089]
MTRDLHPRAQAATGGHAATPERMAVLGAYSVAGYPDVPRSAQAFLTFSRNGAGLLEVGVPATDPWLDGQSIADAHEVALLHGDGVATTVKTLQLVTPATDRPVLCMAYWQTVHRFGPERFAREIAAAGASGCLIADVPTPHRARWAAVAAEARLAAPLLADRDAPAAELQAISRAATGFVYAPATHGQRTGYTADLDLHGLNAFVARIRRAAPTVPVLSGIGISTPALASSVAARCGVDGVVIGSPLVRALGEGGPDRAGALIREFANSIHNAVPEVAA